MVMTCGAIFDATSWSTFFSVSHSFPSSAKVPHTVSFCHKRSMRKRAASTHDGREHSNRGCRSETACAITATAKAFIPVPRIDLCCCRGLFCFGKLCPCMRVYPTDEDGRAGAPCPGKGSRSVHIGSRRAVRRRSRRFHQGTGKW